MPRRLALTFLLLSFAAPALADSLLTLRSGIEGLKMDQPKTGEVKIWLGDDKLTLHQLAAEFGVSAERIRQIEAQTIARLRSLMA